MSNQHPSAATDVGEFVAELGAGQFERKLSVALSRNMAIKTDHMQFFSDGNQLTKGLALNAIRSINIEAMRKAENTVSNFSETGSVLEQISANSKETLPSLIYFTCFPYEGLDSREFVVRLGIITSDDKPRLCLRIRQFDQHREEMRKELAGKIGLAVQGLPDVKVLNGTFASK